MTLTVHWAMPAWRSAAGTWRDRTSTLLVAEVDGARGLGESAPLPGLSQDPTAALSWARLIAHLDATARARNLPLSHLLSGSRTPPVRIPRATHRESGTGAVCAVVEGPAAAVAAVMGGYRTVKVKVMGGIAEAAGAVAAIRAAVGPEIAIRADANRGFALEEVPRLCDALAVSDLEYLEEPAPGIGASLRAPLAVPIALDESLIDAGAWLDGALASPALAALVIKPTLLGAERALGLIARAAAGGVDVVISHALEGPVGFAACAELALAIGGSRAHGLAPHPGLAAWRIAIPTLVGAALVDVPRAGTGLDVDAVLARAEELR